MRSKVLTEAAAEAQPVIWRRSIPIATKAAQPVEGMPDELLQLRARLAEVSAAAEQQARHAYETGLRTGEANARKAMEPVIERLTNSVTEIANLRPEILHRAEADTVRLAIEIARRVVHRELSVDPNALEALTKAALDKLQSQEIHRVRVHPDLEKHVRAAMEKSGRGQNLTVIADASQPPGAILFDIGRGTLDASVTTQLAEIERGLTDQLDNRS
jgi:flagellar assembly protein FliH